MSMTLAAPSRPAAKWLATVRSALVPGLMPRCLQLRVVAPAARHAAPRVGSPARSSRSSAAAAAAAPRRATAGAVLAHDMGVGKGGEEGEIGGGHRPGLGPAGGAAGQQPRHAERRTRRAKPVAYCRGDPVAAGGRAHRLEQRDRRARRATSCRRCARARRARQPDGPVGEPRHRRRSSPASTRPRLARSSPPALRPRPPGVRRAAGCRDWCSGRRRPASPRRRPGSARRRRGRGRPACGAATSALSDEVGHRHAVAGGMDDGRCRASARRSSARQAARNSAASSTGASPVTTPVVAMAEAPRQIRGQVQRDVRRWSRPAAPARPACC